MVDFAEGLSDLSANRENVSLDCQLPKILPESEAPVASLGR